MIYDIHTKNISFLKVCKYLRDRGIKNNKFMLTLYDDDLVGIDPYRKDLGPELQLKVYRECCKNIWYFIREVVRIPAEGELIRYELNLGNLTLTYLRNLNECIILILPRQHGKTMGEVIVDIWNYCFVTQNSNAIYMNKGKGDAIKNLKLFRDLKEALPRWMLDMFINDPKKDIDNQESKLIARRNNTLKVVSPGTDRDSAEKAGRGLTTATIVFDEFAFMKFNELTYKSAAFAYSKASENAKKHKMPYGIVITTTPNNLDVPAGEYCYGMIQDAAKWIIEWFDIPTDKLHDLITANSKNNFVFVQYSYKELGRTEEWVEKQRKMIGNDERTLKREVFLVWPNSMEGAVFNENQLDKVLKFIKPPLLTLLCLNNTYPVTFYEKPELNMNYILSCDVAGGLSNDNSVITIIHPEDFRVVGDFRSSKIDTDTFRRLIEELMSFYLKQSVLVIEKTGIGSPVIDALMKNPVIEPRMYREDVNRLGEKKISDGFVVKAKTKRIIYGVDTVKQTRDQMMDMLFDIVENEYDKIVSENIYKDLVTLERKRNNKIEHASGKHDDSIMSYLIFRWAVYYGRCFRDRFGINPVPSRANIKIDGETAGVNEKMAVVFNTVRNAEIAVSLDNNNMYKEILNQTQKLNATDRDKSQAEIDKLNTFMRIANLNSDSEDNGSNYNGY